MSLTSIILILCYVKKNIIIINLNQNSIIAKYIMQLEKN